MMRRRLNYKNHKFIFGVIILFVLVGMGVGFSYLNANLSINGTTTVSKNTWDVHFQNIRVDSKSVNASTPATIDLSGTGVKFSVNLSKPGDVYSFTVDVVNTGSIDAMVSGLTKTALTDAQSKYLEYIVTYSDGSNIIDNELLSVESSRKVMVTVRYKKDITTEDLPADTDLLNLSFNITYVQSDECAVDLSGLYKRISVNAVLDNIASTYVNSSTGIDFSKVSSDTNGKGVYLLASTKDSDNPIYYYRGAVTNNNLKFANFCWKIVRTTETGGVKLIYNGTPDSNGGCTNTTGQETQIGQSSFNIDSSDNAYVGYMYGTLGSSTYGETHKNINDSEIKKVIDDWYSKNMTDYTDKLEDTVWCNDRSVVTDSDYTGDGSSTTKTMYGSRNRLYVNKTPSLECVNYNDRFTVKSSNGNGKLTYPVALLTADEIAYAGGRHRTGTATNNFTYYLYTGEWYWTLSPYWFDSDHTSSYELDTNGRLYTFGSHVSDGGVRPSISLKPGITITGGDGTANSPYVVK